MGSDPQRQRGILYTPRTHEEGADPTLKIAGEFIKCPGCHFYKVYKGQTLLCSIIDLDH